MLYCGGGHNDLEFTRLVLIILTYPLPRPLVLGGSLTWENVNSERVDEERPAPGVNPESGAGSEMLKFEFVKGPWPNVPHRNLVGATIAFEEVTNVTPG